MLTTPLNQWPTGRMEHRGDNHMHQLEQRLLELNQAGLRVTNIAKTIIMQSQSRRIKRIMAGVQSESFSSTKVAKVTPYAKAGLPGHRKNRALN